MESVSKRIALCYWCLAASIFAAILIIASTVQASVLVSGSNGTNQWGRYWNKGFADVHNIPGARDGAISWTDATGNLWLFGGRGYDVHGDRGELNDLWKYDPSSGLWTWVSGSDIIRQLGFYGVKGIPSPNNLPAARTKSISWIDNSGNLWLFGGWHIEGWDFDVPLNDLWKYEPSSGLWTWVSGSNNRNQPGIYGVKGVGEPNNVPGARGGSVSWIDASGNLWLFGGYGLDWLAEDYGWLNDLWKYEPATGLWTWMSGSDTINQAGVYWVKGFAHPLNIPGARESSISWIDSSGNLWLFGGVVWDSSYGATWYLNDLWKYEPSSGLWTWVSGSDIANEGGSYGVKGIAGANNVPGARNGAISWMDSTGNLWLFGGSSGNLGGYLNDLWKYELSSGLWTWVSGSNQYNSSGYLVMGFFDPNNQPGARRGSISWIDSRGTLWLFGGCGIAVNFPDSTGYLNDLWKFSCDNLVEDLNGDCKVDLIDFSILCSHWLEKGRIE
jgi:hypothetical protein